MKQDSAFNNQYLSTRQEKVFFFNEMMGTNLKKLDAHASNQSGMHSRGCKDYLNLSQTDRVTTIHTTFLDVGVEVIENNSFRSNHSALAEYELVNKAFVSEYTKAAIDSYHPQEYFKIVRDEAPNE